LKGEGVSPAYLNNSPHLEFFQRHRRRTALPMGDVSPSFFWLRIFLPFVRLPVGFALE
jgi:hypothetical protein